MAFQRVKGTNDFFPRESAILQYVLGTMANVCQRYGFCHVTVPAIETMKCLTAKSGEELKNQLFALQKRGSEEIGLRFDLTVPMTRMFVSKQRELIKPTKWFTADVMWRYEAPQKGREREFYQISVENFGPETPESDSEIINLLYDCLSALGLKDKDFIIKVNNRKLLEGILQDLVPKGKTAVAMRIVDKKAKISQAAFLTEMKKLGVDSTKAKKLEKATSIKAKPAQALKEIAKLKLNKLAKEGFDELKNILSLVKLPNLLVDLSTARGLAYYTGCVWEAFDSKESMRSLAAGGRYDKLVELLGGQPCPAVGVAPGCATIMLLLAEKGLLPKTIIGPDYFVVVVNETSIPKAIEISNKMRKKGAIVEMNLMRRNISKQFDYANRIKAKNVIVVGPEEIKTAKFTVKDMKTGKEQKVKLADL